MLSIVKSFFKNAFRRRRVERELDAELDAYVAELAEEKMKRGLPAEAAWREARLELGGREQVKEEVRAVHVGAWLDSVAKDLGYAVRVLRRSPGFTAAVVLTLALGIGVNTSIFSVVNAMLFEPLQGVRAPERLAWLRGSSSYQDFQAYREEREVFAGMAALGGVQDVSLLSSGHARLVKGELVTPTFFATLGVEAALGRTFLADEEAPVVVVSDRMWRRQFGGDPALVGRSIVVNGESFTVIGVTPPGFLGPEVGLPRDLWIPMAMIGKLGEDRLADRRFRWLNVIVRLRPDVPAERAEAALATVAARQAAAGDPQERFELQRSVELMPVAGGLDPRDREGAVVIAAFLFVVVGLVLLTACANVAGLLLARASARSHEIYIRLALGATRGRVVRQLLTEALLLALLGAGGALVFAAFANGFLGRLAGGTPITMPDFVIDGRVLGFTLALALVTTLIFGLTPALQASRAGRPRTRLRRFVVGAQVALSFLLLIGAGLFTRSLLHARAIDPGFSVENGVLVDVSPGMMKLSPERGQELYRRILAEAGGTLMERAPFGLSSGRTIVEDTMVGMNVVGPGYFAVMGLPLVRGREAGAGEVVVNETLARTLGVDVGKSIRIGDGTRVIAGVAADARYETLGESRLPFLYEPLADQYRGTMTLLVRTADPRALETQLRLFEVPMSEPTTLAARVDFALLPARLAARFLGGFGFLALTLAVVGLAGLVAYQVRQRTAEIGIRTALGARPRDVLKLLLGETLVVVAIGLGVGLALALGLLHLVGSAFYGISAHDPLTYLAVALLFLLVSAAAIYLPARRALAVDPTIALRVT